ncbi:hypothetical protein EV361DRAFT_963242 [Lentinula raphanica]|uniref:Zn(2)-C6 fungal-type domain-containing protein n=1 Tax=Lentinula raphanica TaxID=153919 RepID=A0AA38P6I9_9AGAR|nr:hypothetical protein F5878DRAFT_564363 [Lentinula raphanica]KAJ3970602.1 hypothetical protein EV361DRAFT_963242 [Lentinula raphanica]
MPDSDSTPPSTSAIPPRKRRAKQACDECSRRRVKCNGTLTANGICSNCISLQMDCTYTSQKKKRGPKVGSKRRPPSEVATLIYTILAAPQSFALPEDPQNTRNMLIDLASYARSLDDKLHRTPSPTSATSKSSGIASRSSPLTSLPEAGPEEDRNCNMEYLATRIHGLSFDSTGISKFNQVNLLQTALDIRDEMYGMNTSTIVLRKRSEFWDPAPWTQIDEAPQFVFPEDDLLRDLVSIYFSRLHYIYPLFHQPTFEAHVFQDKLHLRNRMFGATLLAVCANAARHSNDPRNLYGSTRSEHSLGWKYFRQIQFIRLTYLQPMTLFEIQLYALSLLFMFPTSNGEGSWPWDMCRPCIQLAQEVVLNIQRQSDLRHRDIVECELWRRAFWVLVLFDLTRGIFTGRFTELTPEQLDFDLPMECDDDYWFNDEPELRFVQPPGKPSYLSYWRHLLTMVVASGRARRKAAADSFAPDQILQRRTAYLNNWIDNVPIHLRWDPQNPDTIFFHQSLMLQYTYTRLLIQNHKALLRPGPMNFTSLSICTNAARSYLHIIQIQHQRPDCYMLPNLIHQVFMCGVILLINLWKRTWMNSMPDQEKETAEVYKCLQFLAFYERRYESAGRLYDVLSTMISASGIPTFPVRPPALKRSRSHEESELIGWQDSYEERKPYYDPSHCFQPQSSSSSATEGPFSSHVSPVPQTPIGQSWGTTGPASNMGSEVPGPSRDPNRGGEDWDMFMGMVDEMLYEVRSNVNHY